MQRDDKPIRIDDLMGDCCDAINEAGGFPPPLGPEQQAQFALGFYHQRAELGHSAKWSKNANSTRNESQILLSGEKK